MHSKLIPVFSDKRLLSQIFPQLKVLSSQIHSLVDINSCVQLISPQANIRNVESGIELKKLGEKLEKISQTRRLKASFMKLVRTYFFMG